MSILLNFIVGFVASFIGVLPPGLLNMSAAKISMRQGRKLALLFSTGVAITVCIQTFVALLFSRYLDKHPETVELLQKVALGIFVAITLYFFFIAKDTRQENPREIKYSNKNRFFYGVLLAALNLLPFPYWVYLSIGLSSFGWFSFEKWELWSAIIASGLGTFSMLIIYIEFFKNKQAKERPNINMNYIIGLITLVISIITFIKIV